MIDSKKGTRQNVMATNLSIEKSPKCQIAKEVSSLVGEGGNSSAGGNIVLHFFWNDQIFQNNAVYR